MNDEEDSSQKHSGQKRAARGRRKSASTRPRRPSPRTTSPRAEEPTFPIVGIGASAGGVEAMSALLEHLPDATGMAFVLIQHLAPRHDTILPEILSRKTKMTVSLAQNDTAVRPDNLYIIPPGADMVILGGRLNLSERTTVGGGHLPIDMFLRSLAGDQGGRAIGIILSGSSADGSLGMVAVKAEGGLTFAQDPDDAKYDVMPRSAIAAGAVDLALSPAKIAEELGRLGTHPYLMQRQPEEPPEIPPPAGTEADHLGKIFMMLRNLYGVDFSTYRQTTVRRRIDRRIALHRLHTHEEYSDFLRENPEEAEDLYHDILITVTEFFREPEAFRTLVETTFPRILQSKGNDEQVRVWVPGCATGEETYSLALSLLTVMKDLDRNLPVKIFGTDVSERDIDKARAGLYPENKVQQVPEQYRSYFARANGAYRVSKALRDMCIFARHNVTSDPPFSQLDFISCRNVLIYLSPAAQERVISVFHYALRPGGYLMLGTSESIGSATALFDVVDKKNRIFVKREASSGLPLGLAYPHSFRAEPHDAASPRGPQHYVRFDPQPAADALLLTEFVPPSVVVNDRFEILRFRGHTDRYLAHATGRASLNLLDMARQGLAPELQRVVEQAGSSGRSADSRARYRASDGVHDVDLHAIPIRSSDGASFFLVVFSSSPGTLAAPLPEDRDTRDDVDPVADERREVAELRRELIAAREYTNALMSDREAAVEELRAANEEIQSSNEELQSTNEELETAKEELQSTNEELRTVNEELEHRNVQLSRLADDLNNLLRAVNVPTIMVGRDLRVRRFMGTDNVMNLLPSDIGRPITDITPRVQLEGLVKLLHGAIDQLVEHEVDIADESGHWYSLRVRPYLTEQNQVDGAVITLQDIDDLRRSMAQVTELRQFSLAVDGLLSILTEPRPPQELVPELLREATKTLGASASLVLGRNDRGDGWRTLHSHGLSRHARRRFTDDELAHVTEAFLTRHTVAVGDVGREGGADEKVAHELALAAAIAVPHVTAGGEPIVADFIWATPQADLVENVVKLAAELASLVALTLRPAGEA